MLYVVLPDRARWSFYPRPYPGERYVGLRARTLVAIPKESAALGEWGDTLIADTEYDLTPEFLTAELMSYLDALRDMQNVVYEISRMSFMRLKDMGADWETDLDFFSTGMKRSGM